MVKPNRFLKLKTHLFTQDHHTALLNYMLIGLQKIIEKHMVYLHATEYCLITNLQLEVKHLLPEKLQEQFLVWLLVYKINFI